MKIQDHPTLKPLFKKAEVTGINKENALVGQNLSGKDISGLNLNSFNLQGTIFNGANLRNCILNGCDLQNAQLRGCNLTNAKLRGADLRGANLNEANFQYADLRGANLNETDVTETNFRNAYGLSQHIKHNLQAQGAFLEKHSNIWLVEKFWLPIAVGVTVTIFSAILGLIVNSSQHQDNSSESKVPINSIERLKEY